LTQVPTGVIRAFTRMQARLEAEESLVVSERMAIGAGNRKRDYHRTVVQRWMRAADVPKRARKGVPLAELAAMGIQVVMEEPKAATDK
jgi:hypothetical protein